MHRRDEIQISFCGCSFILRFRCERAVTHCSNSTSPFDVNYELEFEKADEGGYERDGVFEWFAGVSYRFIRNWSAGLEFWNHHEFADATVREHSAYFIGPTVRLSATRIKSSPRTTVTFSVTSTRNTMCG
jgi:hypothetical protein